MTTISTLIRTLADALLAVLLVLGGATAVAAPTVTYYHNDLLGSPMVATDASGNVIWREDYSGYGERKQTDPTAAGSDNKVWYTSRHQDEGTGLVYMGARYYDPALGRFLSVDPVHFVEGNIHSFNRYAYANNNPYRYKDPDGRWAEDAVIGIPSMALGASSLWSNVKGGNYWSAAVDVAGIVVDAAAIATPGVPGGAGFGIAASRKLAAEATEKGAQTLYHYTDAVGAKGIAESGVIRADTNGKVFLTDQKLSASEVKDRLFIGRSGEKGSHVVEIQATEGLAVRRGKNANELIHQGSVRDGCQGTLTVKRND